MHIQYPVALLKIFEDEICHMHCIKIRHKVELTPEGSGFIENLFPPFLKQNKTKKAFSVSVYLP